MADVASGSADKSIQVKLVLLGRSLFRFPPQNNGHLVVSIYSPTYTDSYYYPGEAAVGKSSVVLRFVCSFLSYHSNLVIAHQLNGVLGLRRISSQQRAYNRCRIPHSEMPPRRPCAPL